MGCRGDERGEKRSRWGKEWQVCSRVGCLQRCKRCIQLCCLAPCLHVLFACRNPQLPNLPARFQQASWHEERQLTTAGPAMSEAFHLCSLTVCRTQLPDSSGPAAGGGGGDAEHAPGLYFGGYELLLQQDLSDGLYHEPEESAATLRLQVGRRLALHPYNAVCMRVTWCSGLWQRKPSRDQHSRGNSCKRCAACRAPSSSSYVPALSCPLPLPPPRVSQVCDIVGLEWETTQSLNQGENEYRPALVLHVLHSGGAAATAAAAADAAGQPADRATAAKQPLSAPQRTPDSVASRPGSRARSRLGAEAAGSGNGSREPSPSNAAAGLVTPPQLLRPSPSAAATGRLAGGVGGSIRRYAVMLNMRRGEDSDGEEEDSSECEHEGGRQGHAAGSSSDEEPDQRRRQVIESAASAAAAAPPGTASRDRRAALQAAAASPLPALPQQGGAALGSSLVQREWQLLGELEYVLRLCILESREQLPHHEVTVRRWGLGWWAAAAMHKLG